MIQNGKNEAVITNCNEISKENAPIKWRREACNQDEPVKGLLTLREH